MQIYINGAYNQAIASSALNVNEKYHIVGTYDGSTIKLYINGELAASKAISGTIGTTTSQTSYAIGANPSKDSATDGFANMKVYNAKIYTKARTAEQIAADYKETLKNRKWAKTHTVTISVWDSHSGLATPANLQYGWSESNSTAPTSWTDLTVTCTAGDQRKTTTITQGGLTGKYYLWVRAKDAATGNLVDIAGNSNTSTTVSSEVYWFDNKAPIPRNCYEKGRWNGLHECNMDQPKCNSNNRRCDRCS